MGIHGDYMEQDYSVVYRNVQYPRLEFKTGKLLLILPEDEDEDKILSRYSSWIEEKKKIINDALVASKDKEIRTVYDTDFKTIVYEFIHQYSDDLGKKPNNVFFRVMNSKWASCSRNGNITVNMLLRYLPERQMSYVIYHEMVHLFEKRHNIIFWNKIEEQFPDWKVLENDLFVYWFLVQREVHAENRMLVSSFEVPVFDQFLLTDSPGRREHEQCIDWSDHC
ncbi:M48 family metallopeptidase [Methanocalculus sp.]|uniref:M48 metallopeptidase family protein n=1 Tax=Methanocalculus sp. TaxID=2004547 RepID=UPI00263832CA|nr:M48 family metallopeptidase [Methanocalculus sp.]MDG6251103.1 M48 family metallopeptidase [Methanocalculus sp.]